MQTTNFVRSSAGLPASKGLQDYRLQDLLLSFVIPHLSLSVLARLRATCRTLLSLLDSKVCSDVWFPAAEHLLPSCQQIYLDALEASSCTQQHQEKHDQQQPQESLKAHAAGVLLDEELHQKPLQSESTHGLTSDHIQERTGIHPIHPVKIQQLLRERSALLQGFVQTPRITCLTMTPYLEVDTVATLWSPGGAWVAMQQRKQKTYGRPIASWLDADCYTSFLVVWNTITRRTCKMSDLPNGQFLAMEWLPASSWLVWAKSHSRDYHYQGRRHYGLVDQSMFCSNVATGQRHMHVGTLHRQWSYEQGPCISANKGLLAYAGCGSVVLLTLPGLEQTAILVTLPSFRGSVKSMSFDSAGTYIAVCWDSSFAIDPDTQHMGGRYFVVFDTATCAQCFNLPLYGHVHFSWCPTSPHLLISGYTTDLDLSILMLDLGTSKCALVPVSLPRPCGPAFFWSADGAFALLYEYEWHADMNTALCCSALQRDGTVASRWDLNPMGPASSSGGSQHLIPPHKLLGTLCPSPHCNIGVWQEINHILHPHGLQFEYRPDLYGNGVISPCMRTIVGVPLRSNAGPDNVRLTQVDLDFAAHSASEHHVPVGPIPRGSHPIWNPRASRVYALMGERYDIWLVGGQQHKLLYHGEGRKLLKLAHAVEKDSEMCDWHRWEHIAWSPDGSKLLLMNWRRQIVIAVAFGDQGNRDACKDKSGASPWSWPAQRHYIKLSWNRLTRLLSQLKKTLIYYFEKCL